MHVLLDFLRVMARIFRPPARSAGRFFPKPAALECPPVAPAEKPPPPRLLSASGRESADAPPQYIRPSFIPVPTG